MIVERNLTPWLKNITTGEIMLVLIEAVSERIFSIQCFCRVSKYDFLSVEEKKKTIEDINSIIDNI